MSGLPSCSLESVKGGGVQKEWGGSSFTAGRHGSSSWEKAYKAFNSGQPTWLFPPFLPGLGSKAVHRECPVQSNISSDVSIVYLTSNWGLGSDMTPKPSLPTDFSDKAKQKARCLLQFIPFPSSLLLQHMGDGSARGLKQAAPDSSTFCCLNAVPKCPKKGLRHQHKSGNTLNTVPL